MKRNVKKRVLSLALVSVLLVGMLGLSPVMKAEARNPYTVTKLDWAGIYSGGVGRVDGLNFTKGIKTVTMSYKQLTSTWKVTTEFHLDSPEGTKIASFRTSAWTAMGADLTAIVNRRDITGSHDLYITFYAKNMGGYSDPASPRMTLVSIGFTGYDDSVSTVTPGRPTIHSIGYMGHDKNGYEYFVSWKQAKNTKGYQIQESMDSSFKNGVKKMTKKHSAGGTYNYKAFKVSTSFFKSNKGRKFYIRIRGYTTVNGKTVYGKWSTVKSSTFNTHMPKG